MPGKFFAGKRLYAARGCAAIGLMMACLSADAKSQTVGDAELEVLSEALPTVIDMMNERKELLKGRGVPLTDYSDVAPAQGAASLASQHSTGLSAESLPTGYRDGQRNPFGITRQLYRERELLQGEGEGIGSYQRSEFVTRMPKLKLRGVINKRRDPEPIALLDIGNEGVHMVRVGDRISFNPLDPKQVIRIKQIDRLSVIVEVGTLGDLIVVR